jgi:hypothetical protein
MHGESEYQIKVAIVPKASLKRTNGTGTLPESGVDTNLEIKRRGIAPPQNIANAMLFTAYQSGEKRNPKLLLDTHLVNACETSQPCLLLDMYCGFGATLVVSGLAYGPPCVMVEQLTAVSLTPRLNSSEHYRLAAILRAIVLYRVTLHERYRAIAPSFGARPKTEVFMTPTVGQLIYPIQLVYRPSPGPATAAAAAAADEHVLQILLRDPHQGGRLAFPATIVDESPAAVAKPGVKRRRPALAEKDGGGSKYGRHAPPRSDFPASAASDAAAEAAGTATSALAASTQSTSQLAMQIIRQRPCLKRLYSIPSSNIDIFSDPCEWSDATAAAVSNRLTFKLVAYQYGTEAHLAAAALKLAPALHAVIRLPGNWVGVLMDTVDSGQGWEQITEFTEQHVCKEDSETSGSEALINAFYDSLVESYNKFSAAAVSAYDGSGLPAPAAPTGAPAGAETVPRYFVHGDLRPGNVFCRLTPAQSWEFMFIDYEWAGREGMARFPYSLNVNAGWVQGVLPGSLITSDIDRRQLELLAVPRSILRAQADEGTTLPYIVAITHVFQLQDPVMPQTPTRYRRSPTT